MQIGVLGINHKSADLKLREKLAKVCQKRFDPSTSTHLNFFSILLSTCNRTEIYFSSEDLAQTHTHLLAILRQEIEEEFEHRIYSYFSSDCFFHLARVTSGIDSAIIGETEIQGQVKKAYESALSFQKLSHELHFLFQKCLKIGKEVRNSTTFAQDLPTLEDALFFAGTQTLGNLSERSILFIGLSEINQTIYTKFKERGFKNITLCNRTYEKGWRLAEKFGFRFLPWERVGEWQEYDLIIVGTKSSEFVIRRETQPLSSCQKLVVDLSVPRNVDPVVGRRLTLLNIDQLNRMIDRKQREKAVEAARIETQLIAGAVAKQIAIFKLKLLQRSQIFLSEVS